MVQLELSLGEEQLVQIGINLTWLMLSIFCFAEMADAQSHLHGAFEAKQFSGYVTATHPWGREKMLEPTACRVHYANYSSVEGRKHAYLQVRFVNDFGLAYQTVDLNPEKIPGEAAAIESGVELLNPAYQGSVKYENGFLVYEYEKNLYGWPGFARNDHITLKVEMDSGMQHVQRIEYQVLSKWRFLGISPFFVHARQSSRIECSDFEKMND